MIENEGKQIKSKSDIFFEELISTIKAFKGYMEKDWSKDEVLACLGHSLMRLEQYI